MKLDENTTNMTATGDDTPTGAHERAGAPEHHTQGNDTQAPPATSPVGAGAPRGRGRPRKDQDTKGSAQPKMKRLALSLDGSDVKPEKQAKTDHKQNKRKIKIDIDLTSLARPLVIGVDTVVKTYRPDYALDNTETNDLIGNLSNVLTELAPALGFSVSPLTAALFGLCISTVTIYGSKMVIAAMNKNETVSTINTVNNG